MTPSDDLPSGILADASFSMIRWPDPRHGPWGIRANWVLQNGRPECVGLQIWHGADQGSQSPLEYLPFTKAGLQPITATGIAALPIATIIDKLRLAARDHWRSNEEILAQHLPAADAIALAFTAFEEPDARRPGAPRRYGLDHFVEVAHVYLDAWRAGSANPTEVVADHFHVTRSAAAKWVARCRSNDLQLLTPAVPGKSGAEPGTRLTVERPLSARKRGKR